MERTMFEVALLDGAQCLTLVAEEQRPMSQFWNSAANPRGPLKVQIPLFEPAAMDIYTHYYNMPMYRLMQCVYMWFHTEDFYERVYIF